MLRNLIIIMLCSGGMILNACSNKTSDWPAEEKEKLVTECLADNSNTESACQCLVDKMTAKYSYAETQDMQQKAAQFDESNMQRMQEFITFMEQAGKECE